MYYILGIYIIKYTIIYTILFNDINSLLIDKLINILDSRIEIIDI